MVHEVIHSVARYLKVARRIIFRGQKVEVVINSNGEMRVATLFYLLF